MFVFILKCYIIVTLLHSNARSLFFYECYIFSSHVVLYVEAAGVSVVFSPTNEISKHV